MSNIPTLIAAFEDMLDQMSDPRNSTHELGAFIHGVRFNEMRWLVAEYKAHPQPASLWRPVVYPPADGAMVLVYCPLGNERFFIYDIRQYISGLISPFGIEGVTHWMPLPERPA